MSMTELEMMKKVDRCITYCWQTNVCAMLTKELLDAVRARVAELEAAAKEAEPFSPEALEAKITAIEELIEPFSQRNTDASVQYQHLSLRVERLEKTIERFSDRFDCVPLRVSILEVAVGKMQAAQAAQEGQPCSS